jgi:WD40 repeat protein
VLSLLSAGATWQWLKAQKSERQARAAEKTARANETRALTALSRVATKQGYYSDAVKLALAAWPRSAADARPPLSRTIDALAQALVEPLEVTPPLQHNGYRVLSAAFSADNGRLLTVSEDKTARVWDAATGRLTTEIKGQSSGIDSAVFQS